MPFPARQVQPSACFAPDPERIAWASSREFHPVGLCPFLLSGHSHAPPTPTQPMTIGISSLPKFSNTSRSGIRNAGCFHFITCFLRMPSAVRPAVDLGALHTKLWTHRCHRLAAYLRVFLLPPEPALKALSAPDRSSFVHPEVSRSARYSCARRTPPSIAPLRDRRTSYLPVRLFLINEAVDEEGHNWQ